MHHDFIHIKNYLLTNFKLTEWLSWEVEHLRHFRIAFAGLMIAKDLWKICLALINLDHAKRWEVPPPEYGLPQDGWEIESWKREMRSAVDDSVNKFLIGCYGIILNLITFFTPFYPFLWRQAAVYGRTPTRQVTLFVTVDFCLYEVVRLAFKYTLMPITKIEFNVTWVSGLAGLGGRIILVHLAYILLDLIGMKWIVRAAMLLRIYDAVFLRLKKLPGELFIESTVIVSGTNEIEELATNQNFPVEDILLDATLDAPSKATYHNLLLKKRIVVTKTLLDLLEPSLATPLIAHEICHWKMGHGYVDHVCHVLVDAAILYLCELAYEEPSFAGFFNLKKVHPIIPFWLVVTVVWPAFEEFTTGLAGFLLTHRIFQCDDCTSRIANRTKLLEALVKLAPVPSCQKFSGLFSSWFYGEPSLIQRIRRITKQD